MKVSKWIFSLSLLVIAAVGFLAYSYYVTATAAPVSETLRASWSSLIDKSGDWVCVMENQKQNGDEWSIRAGTIYLSNGKARGDFVVGTPGSEFIEEEHILRDGGTTYLWLNGSRIIPVETEVWRSNPEYGMKGITFGQSVQYEWRCTEGKNSPFMFKLPGAFPVDR